MTGDREEGFLERGDCCWRCFGSELAVDRFDDREGVPALPLLLVRVWCPETDDDFRAEVLLPVVSLLLTDRRIRGCGLSAGLIGFGEEKDAAKVSLRCCLLVELSVIILRRVFSILLALMR